MSGAAVAVALQLAFAAAFVVDAVRTNPPYDALAGHRVAVAGRSLGCAEFGSTRSFVALGGDRYDDRGDRFTMHLTPHTNATVYVDPDDPSVRMLKVDFDGGPDEITVDLVDASLLVAGALVVGTLHELHRRRRRRRRHPQ